MVTALTLLRPLIRRCDSRPKWGDTAGWSEMDLTDVSVSEFRRCCSWE